MGSVGKLDDSLESSTEKRAEFASIEPPICLDVGIKAETRLAKPKMVKVIKIRDFVERIMLPAISTTTKVKVSCMLEGFSNEMVLT